MGYRVTAPLVQVENEAGNFIQLKEGSTLPSDVTDKAIAHLIEFGYIEDDAAAGDVNLDGMKVPELKAFAKEHGVDLGDAKTKPDIIAAIELHFDADDESDNEE